MIHQFAFHVSPMVQWKSLQGTQYAMVQLPNAITTGTNLIMVVRISTS